MLSISRTAPSDSGLACSAVSARTTAGCRLFATGLWPVRPFSPTSRSAAQANLARPVWPPLGGGPRRRAQSADRPTGPKVRPRSASTDTSWTRDRRLRADFCWRTCTASRCWWLACLAGRPESGNGELTRFYGSVHPAIWSFQLALRARGTAADRGDRPPRPLGQLTSSTALPRSLRPSRAAVASAWRVQSSRQVIPGSSRPAATSPASQLRSARKSRCATVSR